MHPAGAIVHSDDKRQVTAVLAVTPTGEFLPPHNVILRSLCLIAGTFGTVVTIGQMKIQWYAMLKR